MLGEEDHGDKIPLSSYDIKGPRYPHQRSPGGGVCVRFLPVEFLYLRKPQCSPHLRNGELRPTSLRAEGLCKGFGLPHRRLAYAPMFTHFSNLLMLGLFTV